MPRTPNADDLRNLLAPRVEPCISLFLPLPRYGPELEKAAVRFRSLVRQAEGLLAERYDGSRVKALLAPLQGLAEAPDVFSAGPEALAAFRAEGLFETYRLWPAPPEGAVVADTFHVKPLLRCLQDRHRYYVLALGARRARLFEGSERGLVPRVLPGLPSEDSVPTRLESAGRSDPVRALRGGSAGSGPGKAPPVGDGSRREELLRTFRTVGAALRESIGDEAPLVVAAAAPLLPVFREVGGHPSVQGEGVEGAADEIGVEELHARTLSAARKALDERDRALAEDFGRQLDRGQGADVLTRVAEAAVAGRVRRLLVSDGKRLFGRVDRASGEVTLHAGQTGPQDDDVLDDLAEIVLSRGGEVLVLEPARMPGEAAAVASFRW
jgi:hypothetical protein